MRSVSAPCTRSLLLLAVLLVAFIASALLSETPSRFSFVAKNRDRTFWPKSTVPTTSTKSNSSTQEDEKEWVDSMLTSSSSDDPTLESPGHGCKKCKRIIMPPGMGKTCNLIDELAFGMYLARRYRIPLVLWGHWLKFVKEEMDEEHFYSFMGGRGKGLVVGIKPGDPAISHDAKFGWTFRACGNMLKLEEFHGLLPAKKTREAAAASILSLKKSKQRPVVFVFFDFQTHPCFGYAPEKNATDHQSLQKRSPKGFGRTLRGNHVFCILAKSLKVPFFFCWGNFGGNKLLEKFSVSVYL